MCQEGAQLIDYRGGMGLITILLFGGRPWKSTEVCEKWLPNLLQYFGRKDARTKRAPIVGAHLVLSNLGPKKEPSLRDPTHINSPDQGF